MCGIAGKINFDKSNKIEMEELKRMTDSITHRGPDDEGHYIDNNVGLGFRRLSIIDLKTGHQPLSNSNNSLWITFNGEIYNYKQLRTELEKKGKSFKTETDTEVILLLYEEYGIKCLDYLRGMFAFVIWDDNKKELFGARDRFGIKPFCYYIDDQSFVWGSEIKAIKASSNINKTINLNAVDSYFSYGYIMKDLSIYNEIKKIEAAHYFIFNPYEKEKLLIKRYWDVDFNPDYSKSKEYWENKIQETLQETIKLTMISDVPIGAFLSGGIDSSIVVALMSKISSTPINTFSIGFKEKKYNELNYAKLVADKYGTKHHELVVDFNSIDLIPELVRMYDEPFADSSAIPTFLVSKFASETVKVVLSGDGGDELFAGYDSYSKMLSIKNKRFNNNLTNNLIFGNLNKLIPDYFFGKGYTYYHSKDKNKIGAYFNLFKDYERKKLYTNHLKKILGSFMSEDLKLELISNDKAEFISKMQKLDIKTYMVDDILTKVDRASMFKSLEVRVPILDHVFAELSFKIPSEFKINKVSKKHIFKESFKHLLPEEIISHKKQGFGIPINEWLKGPLKEYAYGSLLDNSAAGEFINRKYVEEMLNNHQKNVRDYSAQIWSLLIFNEWLRQNKNN
jgi:asparagine synthase (glutamine-hydrolysing)